MMKAVTTFALVTLVLLAACREENVPDPQEPVAAPSATSATDSAAHPASPGGTAAVPDVDAGTTVVVVLTEGSIGVRGQSIPPGVAVLTVENAGKEAHNLFVEGEGISRAAGDTIAAGATSSIDVNFKPGTYTLYCPLLDHRNRGEQTQITISADAATDTAPRGNPAETTNTTGAM